MIYSKEIPTVDTDKHSVIALQASTHYRPDLVWEERPIFTGVAINTSGKIFVPEKLVIGESVKVVFGNKDSESNLSIYLGDALDIKLFSAFIKHCNCLPAAPTRESAIECVKYGATVVGNRLDWPDMPIDAPLQMEFLLKPEIETRVASSGYVIPAGFELKYISVTVSANVFGFLK